MGGHVPKRSRVGAGGAAAGALVMLAALAWAGSAQTQAPPPGTVPTDAGECPSASWPLAAVRALLSAPAVPLLESGNRVAVPMAGAVELRLAPQPSARLPFPPERAAPAGLADPQAGYLELSVPADGRTWQVSLSDAAWIDLVAGGTYAAALAHTGPRDCPGVRKSVRFALPAGTAVLQLSGAGTARVRLVITAAD